MKTGKRILIWIIVLILSIIFTIKEKNDSKLVQQVNAYVSPEFKKGNEDINKAVEHSFKVHKLGVSLKVSNKRGKEDSFVITSDIDEISSVDYEILGRTPLIVVVKQKKKLVDRYIEKGLLECSKKIKMDESDEVEINFKKLMDIVQKEKIRIFYPELTTVEGKLFKQFLIITANGGSYPSTQEQMETAQEQTEQFLANPNVQGVNVMNRLTGVNDIGNDIYVTFENNVMLLEEDRFEDIIFIAYPKETVVKEVIFESTSEIGDKTQQILGRGRFLTSSIIKRICYYNGYRFDEYKSIEDYRDSMLYDICNEVNFKDSYNYIEIPRKTLITQ